jgi:hypothetical protein
MGDGRNLYSRGKLRASGQQVGGQQLGFGGPTSFVTRITQAIVAQKWLVSGAPTMQLQIEQLLLEIQRAKFMERRTEPRQPFVRPVSIHVGREAGVKAFSKNMSQQGIGIIAAQMWDVGTIATIRIHSLTRKPVYLRCELRWCDPYGDDWYLTGWKFLSEASRPMEGG